MCIRINKIIIVISLLFLCNISYSSDLPECPNSPYDESSDYQKTQNFQNWHNCIGMYIHPNRGFYEGPYENGKRNGFGYYEDANNTMTGDFVNDYPNGQIYIHYLQSDGKYLGVNKLGAREGYGTYFFSNGEVWQGKWENDKFVSGTKYKPGEFNQTVRFYERPIYNFKKTIEEPIEEETNSDILNIEEAKASCKDIGFKEGTEKFGECVLELTR